MPEFYLHYLWITKQVGLFNCQTINGCQLEIIDFGKYNFSSSGPDFYDVLLKIDDLFWFGPVEMHVKSSDWYAHNHQNDRAYDHVILHVVYEYNQSVHRLDGELITLELKDYINVAHLSWFKNFYVKKDNLPCKRLFNDTYKDILLEEWELAAIKRIERKTIYFQRTDDSTETVLFKLLARSFGGNTNQLPFEELTSRIRLDVLLNLQTEQRIQLIYRVSGLLEWTNKDDKGNREDLSAVKNSSWKRKGQRHHSHPVVRVKQFAVLAANWELKPFLTNYQVDQFIADWKKFMLMVNLELIKNFVPQLSKSFMNHLIINGIVPYLHLILKNDPKTVIDSLKKLPAENNAIIRKWKELNQVSKNALQSQGSIEYFNDFCLNFNCLRCPLGERLIYGENTENNVFF